MLLASKYNQALGRLALWTEGAPWGPSPYTEEAGPNWGAGAGSVGA